MAMRPPSNDDDDPDVVEFGIVALDGRIDERDISFPVGADDLVETHGEITVAVDPSGHEMALTDALARCDREQFDSKTDLLDALHPVFENEREAVSGGLLGRLRALLPLSLLSQRSD